MVPRNEFPYRILLIEYDTKAHLTFKSALNHTGFNTRVAIARNPDRATALLSLDGKKLPHLIVLSVSDCDQSFQLIRRTSILHSIPVVILTPSISPSDHLVSIFGNCQKFFVRKPQTEEQLTGLLNSLLKLEWRNYERERARVQPPIEIPFVQKEIAEKEFPEETLAA